MSTSRVLTLAEVSALAAALPNEMYRAAALLAAATGARGGELLAARVSQVMRGDRTLTGELVLPAATAKGRRGARRMPIAPRALQALAIWLSVHPAPHLAALLFPSPWNVERPVTLRQFNRVLGGAARAAGLRPGVSSHSLRKFFGTSVYLGTGCDIAQAAAALGHSGVGATPRYLGLDAERRRDVILSIFQGTGEPELWESWGEPRPAA